jgi:hypothetical protein
MKGCPDSSVSDVINVTLASGRVIIMDIDFSILKDVPLVR